MHAHTLRKLWTCSNLINAHAESPRKHHTIRRYQVMLTHASTVCNVCHVRIMQAGSLLSYSFTASTLHTSNQPIRYNYMCGKNEGQCSTLNVVFSFISKTTVSLAAKHVAALEALQNFAWNSSWNTDQSGTLMDLWLSHSMEVIYRGRQLWNQVTSLNVANIDKLQSASHVMLVCGGRPTISNCRRVSCYIKWMLHHHRITGTIRSFSTHLPQLTLFTFAINILFILERYIPCRMRHRQKFVNLLKAMPGR